MIPERLFGRAWGRAAQARRPPLSPAPHSSRFRGFGQLSLRSPQGFPPSSPAPPLQPCALPPGASGSPLQPNGTPTQLPAHVLDFLPASVNVVPLGPVARAETRLTVHFSLLPATLQVSPNLVLCTTIKGRGSEFHSPIQHVSKATRHGPVTRGYCDKRPCVQDIQVGAGADGLEIRNKYIDNTLRGGWYFGEQSRVGGQQTRCPPHPAWAPHPTPTPTPPRQAAAVLTPHVPFLTLWVTDPRQGFPLFSHSLRL